ncbi:hypothetical protein Tco_0529220 [Tanacetum coccineum]
MVCNIWNEQFNSDTPTPNVRSSSLRVFTPLKVKNVAKNFKYRPRSYTDSGFGSVHIGIIKSLEHPFDDIHVDVKWVKRGQKASGEGFLEKFGGGFEQDIDEQDEKKRRSGEDD